jgi:cytidylate kinase
MMTPLKLVEQQIAMSGIRNRLEANVPHPGRYLTPEGIAFGPYLLISRECGAGGGLLAQEAGARLGWNTFDSKIVDEIAQAAHVHNRLVQTVDEHIHSAWEQTWREFLLEDLPDKKYLRHLSQVIMTLGHQGNVVMVGRGAQYFLPPQGGLRVRLVAPLDVRVQRVTLLDHISPEQARAKIKKVDAERAAFIGKLFKKDVSSPLNHDVVINTGEISIGTTAQIVLAMLYEKLGVNIKPGPKPTIERRDFKTA